MGELIGTVFHHPLVQWIMKMIMIMMMAEFMVKPIPLTSSSSGHGVLSCLFFLQMRKDRQGLEKKKG